MPNWPGRRYGRREEGAYHHGNGAWFLDGRPMDALRMSLPYWFPRVNEIIRLIGSHNVLATPAAGAFEIRICGR